MHEIISSTAVFGPDEQQAVELVSPVATVAPPPRSLPLLTQGLNDRFHFVPSPRADEWDKMRTPFRGDHWSVIREDEYNKAVGTDHPGTSS